MLSHTPCNEYPRDYFPGVLNGTNPFTNPIKGAPNPFYRPFTKGAFLPIEDEGLRLFDAKHGDFTKNPHNQLVTMDDSPDQNNKV